MARARGSQKECQIQDHANHRCGNCREWRGEINIVVRRFNKRPPARINRNDGRNVNQVASTAATAPARKLIRAIRHIHIATNKSHKCHNHDKRPRRGFAQRQTINHLRWREPLIMTNRALVDIRQYRIGTPKGQQRRLGKEPAHLGKRVHPAKV